MADEKQSKTFRASPLDGKQNVSRNTDTYLKRYQYKDELTDMTFSVGEILSQNKGRDVALSDLSSDTPEFTGKDQGFFAQNKSMVKEVSK